MKKVLHFFFLSLISGIVVGQTTEIKFLSENETGLSHQSSNVPSANLRMHSGHPRLFMRPEQVSTFREECKTGFRKSEYDKLKNYVDACMSQGWGGSWVAMSLTSITIVALVENTPEYLNEADLRVKDLLKRKPDCTYPAAGQIIGFTLGSLAMYYDLLWESNSSMRQIVANKLYDCYTVEGTGSGNSHYGNHYFDSVERSTWFALACRGDGYYDDAAETAYQTFLDRWYRDGDLKSIIKQVGGTNGTLYEGAYYFVQNWLPCLSLMLAAFETSHTGVPENFVKENFSMIYYASTILSHAKNPWNRALDQTGDMYDTWHIAGWLGMAVAQKWDGPMGKYLMTQLGNSITSNTCIGDPTTNSYLNAPRALIVLYYQDSPMPEFNEIPKSYDCTSEGGITAYMRSAWNDPAATWASFQATDEVGGHMGAIQGHFQIGKYAPLATKSGAYCLFEDEHHFQYSLRTYSANCVTIYRPDETFPQNPYTLNNDGGQNFAGTFWNSYYTTDIPNLSKDIKYKNNDKYTFSSADITKAYDLNPEKKISKYVRHFIYFNPDYFLIIDKIDALNGSYEKKWLLHTPNQPVINGLSAVADNEEGRLNYKALLPANAKISTIGGSSPGYYYNVYNNKNYPPDCNKYQSQTWRTEIIAPTGNTSDIFLIALQATSCSNNTALPCELLTTVSSGFTGAHFKTATNPRIAICSSTNTKGDRVSFSANQFGWTGTAGVLVTDLKMGTYRVVKDHSSDIPGYSSVIVDSSGTLYFEDVSLGHYEIVALNTSSFTDIIAFAIPGQIESPIINTANHTVSVTMPGGTDLSNLSPAISVPTGATIIPASEVAQDFSSPVSYTVTSEDETATQDWTVLVETISGIKEVKKQKTLTIFPNPSDRFCHVSIVCDAGDFYTIRIHDASGRLIHKSDQYHGPNTLTIPMGRMNPGEYYVNRTIGAKVIDSEKFILL